MAKEFAGLKKEDHEKLTEAATLYRNLLGKDLTGVVNSIPVADSAENEAAAKAKKAEADLKRSAEIQRAKEDADQQARQLDLQKQRESGDIQPENPGPGQPAMVTERAKAAGVSRAGEEPIIAGKAKK